MGDHENRLTKQEAETSKSKARQAKAMTRINNIHRSVSNHTTKLRKIEATTKKLQKSLVSKIDGLAEDLSLVSGKVQNMEGSLGGLDSNVKKLEAEVKNQSGYNARAHQTLFGDHRSQTREIEHLRYCDNETNKFLVGQDKPFK